VTKPATQQRLNTQLEQVREGHLEPDHCRCVPKLPEGAALEDFTIRTATAWRVGRKSLDNGAVLFVFVQDRKMRIEVGYGLEGAIPDVIAKRIISDEITPRFRNGDFDGGLSAGVNALMQAARGEYKGTGTTISQKRRGNRFPGDGVLDPAGDRDSQFVSASPGNLLHSPRSLRLGRSSHLVRRQRLARWRWRRRRIFWRRRKFRRRRCERQLVTMTLTLSTRNLTLTLSGEVRSESKIKITSRIKRSRRARSVPVLP
jgi:hypothetical protein